MTQPFSPQFYPAATIPVGIGPPNVLYAPIEQASLPSYIPNLDFTTVTGATLHVTRPDGSKSQWVCTLTSQTTAGVLAIYALQIADCPVDGPYQVRAYLSVTGFLNSIPCTSTTLQVVAA